MNNLCFRTIEVELLFLYMYKYEAYGYMYKYSNMCPSVKMITSLYAQKCCLAAFT